MKWLPLTVTSLCFGQRRQNARCAPTRIARQALHRELVLVTANVAEFQRFGGLRRENWPG
jgi:predicted nucleic acid-binding protein